MKPPKLILAIVVSLTLFLAWAPWVSDEYAIAKVTEKLGGANAEFSYLGQVMPVEAVPKTVGWIPFGRYVVFPSEAGWFVTFYGKVI